ncbi:hypothetical protein SAMN05216337_103212 [Bradyrhizobium brasilense]|uniref:Uncharacterized protein n=1 Tax=Bradyrhizobium brasilense TaxID=1419277 RepID=A0A1G7EZK2_9BRAD|nr:hypothetical protein SAMN05216337_103212 [Bradyrhizobium brasilense]
MQCPTRCRNERSVLKNNCAIRDNMVMTHLAGYHDTKLCDSPYGLVGAATEFSARSFCATR